MHHLITGGTGFIGAALCRELVARGERVTVLTRSKARAAQRLPAAAQAVEALAQIGTPAPDVVINLAGENLAAGRWNAALKQRFVDSRVGMTRQLVEWLAGLTPRPRVLISGSAVGWYGARGDETLSEHSTSGKADEYQAQLCRAWEAEARRAEPLGVRVCLVRSGLVLERDGGSLAKMLLPFRLGLGGHLGSGNQWLPWIHRADHIALMLWLATHDRFEGPFNATAPNPVTNREFARALGRALHRPGLLPMPAFLLRLLVGEMAELLLTGQRVLPMRALEGGFTFRYPELAAALQASVR